VARGKDVGLAGLDRHLVMKQFRAHTFEGFAHVIKVANGCAAHGDHYIRRLQRAFQFAQQRVQLIAALVNEPELLVLDEPFSGLDPLAMTSMSEMLAEVAAAGTTVLFSSHQLDLVEDICEDVVIINAGRVVRAGDLAELRANVPQRFVTIRFRGNAPDWSRLPSVEVVDQCDGETRLRVKQGTDLAAMIAAAQHDTDLVAFAYEPPTLSELFREAVAA